MDTNTQKKEETKAENAKKEEKFDFKAEAKKWWAAFVAFVKPYKDLNKKPLSGSSREFTLPCSDSTLCRMLVHYHIHGNQLHTV